MVITPLPRRNSVMSRGDRDLAISTRLPGQDWGDGTRTMALIDNNAASAELLAIYDSTRKTALST
jgi:hypothetical protein